MSNLLEPKEESFKAQSGVEKTYILHKFTAIAGREIVAKYNLAKDGDYAIGEETMFKLMNFVCAIDANGKPLRLSTAALVDNHIPDWEVLARIELAMMQYNCSFFPKGKA